MRTRTGLASGAALAAVIGTILMLTSQPSEAELPKEKPRQAAFVRSMEGTFPDGQLKLAAGDALVVDAELTRLFDYYLAGQGEQTLAEIRLETERELERRLKPHAAREAKRLLAAYWRYKAALGELEATLPQPAGAAAALRQRMVARQQLRAQYFTASEMAGLFGFDDAYDQDAVARLEISQDKSLTEQQRQQKLAAQDAALSPALREEREAPRRILMLEESAAKMRAQGASEDEVYRMRAASLTPEAATRLAELDREEAAWKTRIATYQARRTSDPVALQALRDELFTQDEQKRLRAYE
jgi:lipase chaperone LimK